MPKTQNGVNHTKSNDTLTERPKRATKKPDRYRQEEWSQAVSDNDSNDIISDSDSKQTLEARIWALESVIANRANMKKTMKNPEPTTQDSFPSILQSVQHCHSKNWKIQHAGDHQRKQCPSPPQMMMNCLPKSERKNTQRNLKDRGKAMTIARQIVTMMKKEHKIHRKKTNKTNLRDLISATGLVILLQIEFKSSIFRPVWPSNLIYDLEKQ